MSILYFKNTGWKGKKSNFISSLSETLLRSPKLLLSILVLGIFFVSLVVMILLHQIPDIPQNADILLDSTLLILLLYPCIVFLVKRPYLLQIRARERTEEALSLSESRLRLILENNPYFLSVRDADGVVLLASRMYADFFGTAADRMIGVPLAHLHKAAGLNGPDLEKILALDREVVETGKSRFGLERMTHGDGTIHWYRYARLPVTMHSGIRCVLAISSEITRQIKTEEAMRRARGELEQRVEERTAELVKVNTDLRQAVSAHMRAEEELMHSRAQLQNLSAGLQSLLEEERTQISREIHDELGQSLTALKFDLAAVGNLAATGQGGLAEKTKSMILFVDSILTTVKRISRDLRPGVLDDLGLAAAIEWQAKEFQGRTKIPCEVVVVPEDMTVDPERSTAIFRIFQETLTNIIRHAGATHVEVSLECRDGTVSLEVRDNGRGITREEITGSKSLGIIGIRERVGGLGGEVRFEGSPGAGTVVTVTIPVRDERGLDAQYTLGG